MICVSDMLLYGILYCLRYTGTVYFKVMYTDACCSFCSLFTVIPKPKTSNKSAKDFQLNEHNKNGEMKVTGK